MTARQVFEATLIELSKLQAPSLKLYEFNYLFNKAINQYINKVYNVYDINQQTTDDLRVLKSTAFLTPQKYELGKLPDSAIQNANIRDISGITTINIDENTTKVVEHKYESGKHTIITKVTQENVTNPPTAYTSTNGNITTEVTVNGTTVVTTTTETEEPTNGRFSGQASSYLSRAHSSIQSLHGATYNVYLPIDYLHMLNCVCIYYVAKTKDCWDAGSYIEIPATRLTADSWSQIVTDIYNRPSPMRPYYYIHNMNQHGNIPTDPVTINPEVPSTYDGTDIAGNYEVTSYDQTGVATSTTNGSNFQRTFTLNNNKEISLVEKPIAVRVGNTSNVRCEIRYGKDDSLFQLAEVQIDYVKVPQHIRLTQEQIDLTEDTSQIMEFPDYVNQEIINELVHLVMERTNDPRLANNIQISQSIARPTGQQQQPQQAQQG